MPKNPSTSLARRGEAAAALRQLPADRGAEAAVLGSMIVDPRCIPDVLRQLERGDFLYPEHAALYDLICGLFEANEGRGVDGLLVRMKASDTGLLEVMGEGDLGRGIAYLQAVMDKVPSSANVQFYLNEVKDRSRRRFLITTGYSVIEAAYDTAEPIDSVLNDAQGRLFAITERDRRGEEPGKLGDLAVRAYDEISQRKKGMLRGLSSGFYALDDLTCGLRQGDMIVIAGRPSMGKTSLAMDIAMHVGLVQKKGVAVFSLEMSRQQLAERALCAWAEVDSQVVAHGMASLEECTRLLEAAKPFQEAKILIDDSTGLHPFALRAKARSLAAKHGIDLIVVDYLQLMDAPGKIENRQQEITFISRQIKATARELNVPVIALSQLNRGPESREDHRPRMSDLRESGSLEQDSDLIILLHRDDYYKRNQKDFVPNGIAEAIVAKNRKGPVGNVKLTFRERFSKFANHTETPETKVPPLPEPTSLGEEPW